MNNEKQKHLSILPQNLVAADELYNLPSELTFYSAFSSNWLCQDDLNGEIQEAS